MKNMFFFLFFVLFARCKPIDFPYTPNPTLCLVKPCDGDTSILQVVWQKSIAPDSSQCRSQAPLIYNDGVVFTKGCETGGEMISYFNGKNGDKIWSWNNYLFKERNPGIYDGVSQYTSLAFFNDNLERVIYSLDLKNGNTKWSTQIDSGSVAASAVNPQNGYAYNVRTFFLLDRLEKSYLMRTKFDSGVWDTVYVQQPIDRFVPSCELPTIWKSPIGDEIALFQIRYYNFDSTKGRIDVLAYNISQNKEYFRFNDIDKSQAGTVNSPYIYGNRAYVPLARTILCLDMNEKKILWSKDFNVNQGFFTGNHPFLIANNKLYVKPEDKVLYALNPDTGDQIWADTDNGYSSSKQMIFYNGVIYYTSNASGKIYAIEESTGKKIWAEPSPNYFKGAYNQYRRFDGANIGSTGIAIDTANNLLYTSDNYFIMCLKLPKH